jgi:hypothetical protein
VPLWFFTGWIEMTATRTTFLLALALSMPAPAPAQVAVGADLGVYSDYVWRGQTYSNRFVIQPGAWLATAFGSTSASAGLWANVEPGQYDGDTDISEGGGQAGPDLTEWNWWLELGRPLGKHRIAGGVTGYRYPNSAGFTSDFNTMDLYARASLGIPLNPRLSLYWDVDQYRGVYAEGSLMQPIPVSRRVHLEFGALAGVSSGLGGDPAARYAGDGLTHFDLSLATTLLTGGVSVRPALHVQLSADDAAKITRREDCGVAPCPFHSTDTRIWFGARVSWYRPVAVR